MLALWIAALLATASPRPGAQAGPFLWLADGRRLDPARISVDAERGVTFGTGDLLESVPLEDVVEVRFEGTRVPPVLVEEPAVVHLHDGSFLLGRIVAGDDVELLLEVAPGARVPLPVDLVHAVFLGPRARRNHPGRYPVRELEDLLYRRPEAGGDFTSGTLAAFGADAVQFEYRLGEESFPLEQVEALILSLQVELPELEAPAVEVDLAPDGTLVGTFVELDAQSLALQTLLGEEALVLPRELVAGLRFRGPRHRWLSDLAPARVEELPYLGGPEVFPYPYRRDRSVTGRPLEVAGRRYAKGFGCHARTRLEFDLAELPFDRFRMEVGVADEVLGLAHPGSVEFFVELDGEKVWSGGPLRAGDPPAVVGPLELDGRRVLALVADFGEDEDVADRAVFGAPLLYRAGEE